MDWLFLALLLPWVIIAFLCWVVYALRQQHGRTLLAQDELRDRLTNLEQTVGGVSARLAGDRQQDQDHAGHDHAAPVAPEGLPIGSQAPDFELPDLDGKRHTLRDFLGKPLVLVFYSPQCGFCLQMAPRLGELPTGSSNVLVISQGEAAENRRLAEEHGWFCPVVLEEDLGVSNAYQTIGTPTGYLLDSEGRVASDLAIGADAVFRLVPVAADGNEKSDELTFEVLRGKQQAALQSARSAGLSVRESRLNREGLAASSPAPDFTLPDLQGGQRSLSEFRGKRVLLVFSDPECGPCQAMAPKLVELEGRNRDDNLQLLMVSRGDRAANEAKVQEHGYDFPVLLQRGWEVSKDYAMFATPIAYLIDEQGLISKDVAVGADAILKLT